MVFSAEICVMQSEKFRAKREMLAQIIKWMVTTTLLPNILGSHEKNAGPSAWMCTTSYFPNALYRAAKKDDVTAASPPDVKIGTKKFSKKAKK